MKYGVLSFALAIVALSSTAGALPNSNPQISGHYVEVRSCDVYTGACFANSEMGLKGKEAILTWVIDKGRWQGVALDGLKVIAAVKANGTLDDTRKDVTATKAVVIVDAKADPIQRQSLIAFAKAMGGDLLENVAAVKIAAIETSVGECKKGGCASVKAEGLVQIDSRCLGGNDHVCGNEEVFYPPLTKVDNASPAFTEVAAYEGDGLGLKWHDVGSRGAFLATFSL